MIKDVSNNLTPSLFQAFLEETKGEELILTNLIFSKVLTFKDIIDFKLDSNDIAEQLCDSEEIYLDGGEITLLFTYIDFKKWFRNRENYKKLLGNLLPLNEKTYRVAVGLLDEKNMEITHVDSFEGNKKDVIEWLNKQIIEKNVNYLMRQRLVFSFYYNEDIQDWSTLEDLIIDGEVILK